ncbi:hypothetical protein ASH01_17575 [Terrabacter sp. Soil811]|uniref:hypothetical protein n=1 Tax=Terrabacter sp. Soil811 TaxID=1736419 RepID=UPI0006FC4E5F|nr:hypothetical protein [Terrabacter sp. Soil811]KRF42622.1 hypothetical protein ASH01_17575 [Terrabacter sp. Soil811]
MTQHVDGEHAHRILLDHADRKVTGPLEDPAVLAAVVGIERLVVATGSTDVQVLHAALAGRPVPGADPERVAALVAEATRHVVAGLIRRSTGQAIDAGVVNPASGGYEITTDATLLRAAVRAAQGSIDAMPYYGIRYGERGSRFATTDSAWLISLAALAESRAVHQVQWLSRVLAARGMPTWLLEIHLDALVSEVRSVADPAAVGSLPAAADVLAVARRRHVDDELIRSADDWADEALRQDLPVPRTGALMAAAIADERSGVTRDDRALMDWVTDPARVETDVATRLLALRRRLLASAR